MKFIKNIIKSIKRVSLTSFIHMLITRVQARLYKRYFSKNRKILQHNTKSDTQTNNIKMRAIALWHKTAVLLPSPFIFAPFTFIPLALVALAPLTLIAQSPIIANAEQEERFIAHKLDVLLQHTLEFLESSLPSFCANALCAKILVSVAVFIVLWFCRKPIARTITYGIDFALHLSRQDSATREQIQRSLIKPIVVFLFVVSVKISLDILYYPKHSPQELDAWFHIIYVVNGAWLVIVLLQGYVASVLIIIAQKGSDHFRREVINLLLKIAYFIVFIIALLWVLKILGFNISAIIASLGLGGLAVALAVKDMLANFFASVMLLFDNSFSQGERIECGGIDGVVVEMGLRRTTLRTGDNALVLIPNADLANNAITNWSRRKSGRIIRLSIGLTYDSPTHKILECIESIKSMLAQHPLIATEASTKNDLSYALHMKKSIISLDDYLGYKHAAYVVLDELADSSINILVHCFSKGVGLEEYLLAKEQIIIEILRIIDKLELSLAFPSQSLYVESMPPLSSALSPTPSSLSATKSTTPSSSNLSS